MSLMEHVGRWPELWNDHSIAAAATGTALNVGDPIFCPRWLLMFGLALGTTAVWVLVDAVFLTRGTTDEAYRALGVGIRQEALHRRHDLGRGRRVRVYLHVGSRFAGSHVLLAALRADDRHRPWPPGCPGC